MPFRRDYLKPPIHLMLYLFKVPTGIPRAEEQREILLVIGGESPIGSPISVDALLRGRKLIFKFINKFVFTIEQNRP